MLTQAVKLIEGGKMSGFYYEAVSSAVSLGASIPLPPARGSGNVTFGRVFISVLRPHHPDGSASRPFFRIFTTDGTIRVAKGVDAADGPILVEEALPGDAMVLVEIESDDFIYVIIEYETPGDPGALLS